MISAATPAKPATAPSPPRSAVQSTVTLLLLLHFFALAVGVLSNEPTSPFFTALRRTPAVEPYLQLLGQDNSYRLDFTSGGDLDIDFRMEAELNLADGETKQLVFPDPALGGMRYRRYQQLALEVASLAIVAEQTGDEGNESILPKALGTSLLRQYGASDLRFRCRGHLLQALTDFKPDDLRAQDPNNEQFYNKPYEASIKTGRNGVIVVKLSANRESAPAAKANER